MNQSLFNEIVEEFKKQCPWIDGSTTNFEEVDDYEILAELDDGNVISYDYLTKTWVGSRSRERWNRLRIADTEEKWRMLFAKRLNRIMLIEGIVQERLSYLTDISQSSISKYLCGEAVPSAWNLTKLARALNCSESDLTRFN